MTTPFRSDVDALAARHAVLEAELADKVRARDEAARMLAEARAKQHDVARGDTPRARALAQHRRRVVFACLGVMMFALGLVLVARVADQREARAHEFHAIRIQTQFEAYAAALCACPDRACVAQVSNEMNAYASGLRDEASVKSSPVWTKRTAALGERMARCVSRISATR